MGMQLIETIEVGSGGAASIEFTGIPQDGVDLVLVVSARSSSATQTQTIAFNASTAGFTGRQLLGTGSSVFSFADPVTLYATPNYYTSNTFSSSELYISNYASSANKSFSVNEVTEQNATASDQLIQAGLWANTAAITAVKLTMSYAQYSTASLYKITAD